MSICRLALFILYLTSFFFTSCVPESLYQNHSLLKEWEPIHKGLSKVFLKDAETILHGISRKKFDTLTPYIERFEEYYPNGESHRESFYDKFLYYSSYNRQNPSKWHDQYRDNLIMWRDQNPELGTPWITLAYFEVYLAWYARGGGYAHTVSDEGWRLFKTHNKNALKILKNAPNAAKQDPAYYDCLIRASLSQGWDINEILEIFKLGQEVDRNYTQLYKTIVHYLQPKWYGESKNEWIEWLEKALEFEDLTDKERKVIYAQTVRWNILRNIGRQEKGRNTFKKLGVDRDRFLDGVEICATEYDQFQIWAGHLLYNAWWSESPRHIQSAFNLMQGKYSHASVGGTKQFLKILLDVKKNYPEIEHIPRP